MVFAPDHLDGSCIHTQMENGEAVNFDTSNLFSDQASADKKMDTRVKEIEAIVRQIEKNDFFQKYLPFPSSLKLDTDKLVLAGHSFGGGSAIYATAADHRIKACVTLDPYVIPLGDKILQEKIHTKVPVLILDSKLFQTYFPEHKEVLQKCNKSNGHFEWWAHSRAVHDNQCDRPLFDPFEFYLGKEMWPVKDYIEDHLVQSHMIIAFLNKIGIKAEADADASHGHI